MIGKLSLLDAVFGGELLRGTSLETLPPDGMSLEPANTNGASVPGPVQGVTEGDLAAVDAHDEALAADMAADQETVTGGVEPLGLLLDGVFARLRELERGRVELERAVQDLEKAQANQ